MASRPPARVLAGVALIAGCTLALQIVLTRVFSAALFYHFTFLAISLALIGTGGAAMLVYVRPRWFAEPRATGSLALWCVVLAVSLVVVPAALVHLDYTVTSSITLRFALTLAAASVLSAIPFFAAGMTITLAITRYTRWIHRVYAVDLVGAGAGALLIVPLMWEVAAPTLLVGIGLVAAVAAALVAGSARWRSAGVALVALAGIGIVLASETSLYYLDPPIDDEVVSDRWTPLSRVVGYRSSTTDDLANVTYDRDYAPVPRYRPGDPLPDWRTLKTGPQSIGYAMAPRGHVLVIGGGGGRDIYNALSSGQERVDVIELNRAIVETVDDELGPEYGSAYSLPRVNVQTGDGRSELAESEDRYDVINIGFTNTLSGNAAQGYALTENNLYTTEAINVYLDHLAPRGVLSISRLYRLVGDEALRATILSLEALEERGIREPERHVVVLLGRDILGARLGTVLTRLEPWTPAELARIRRLAAERGEGVAFAPGGPYQLEWAQLARADRREDFCANYRVDVCAPTDDKPFFLNFERLSDVGAETPPGYFFSVKPFTVLLIALGVLAAICALAFVAPLALVGREGRPSLSSLGFFAAIGLGFLLLEVAMIQRFVLFLGFPTYSLSVVLASLLAFTGLGAWLSGRFADPRRLLIGAMVAATALIVASAFGLAPLLRSLIDLPFAARILVAAAIIAPFGLLLGTAMPTGLARLVGLYPRGTAWAWGINGVASVLASVVAITVAITWGFTVATLLAAGCYAAAAAHAAFGRWPAPEAAVPEPDLSAAPPALSSRG